jgi:hypothetical protein
MAAVLVLYAASYAVLSLGGRPVPQQVKSQYGDYPQRFTIWAPRFFYTGPEWIADKQSEIFAHLGDVQERWNSALVTLYYPLLLLDRKYWHNRSEALAVFNWIHPLKKRRPILADD